MFPVQVRSFRWSWNGQRGAHASGSDRSRPHRNSPESRRYWWAYDHVLRSAMLGRLGKMRCVQVFLLFVRISYARPSRYSWFDNQGQRRTVTQTKGGEQVNPLMLLVFSIGIQGALEEVSTLLLAGKQLRAFLDDVYFVCQLDQVRFLYDRLGESLFRLHEGETRVWNKSQCQLVGVEELGSEVWQAKRASQFWVHPSGQ